jgi:RNA recognition motif-containing protein
MSEAPAAPVIENGVPPAAQANLDDAPGFKVFVGNLAYTTTDDGLRAFFEPVKSEILSVQVILRGTRSAGYGFVALSTSEAAQKAAELLNKEELDSRQVVVEIAKPADQKEKERKERKAKRRPGRRGSRAVPGEVSEAEAAGEKTEPGAAETGETPKPRKKKRNNRKTKPRQEGGETAEAEAATDDQAPKKPRVKKPKVQRLPRPAGQDPAGDQSKTMLFVANLGFNIDDAGLSSLFTEAGVNVISARIIRRRWGQPRRSRGYGFVDVGGEEEQQKAIQLLQDKDVGGRNIAVKIAVNTPQEESDENKEEAKANVAAPAEA